MMINAEIEIVNRVCQGSVFKNIDFIETISEAEGIIEVSKVTFPYIIVLTQDCDLQQDYTFRNEEKKTQDKWLISVLVAPLYNAEHVYNGEHLSDLGISSEKIKKSGTRGKTIKQNNDPRYHYIEFPESLGIIPSIVDFKHYFSVHVNYLENQLKNFVCAISPLYREDISQRFAAFLSRIGLP